jgi:hypothetical protein
MAGRRGEIRTPANSWRGGRSVEGTVRVDGTEGMLGSRRIGRKKESKLKAKSGKVNDFYSSRTRPKEHADRQIHYRPTSKHHTSHKKPLTDRPIYTAESGAQGATARDAKFKSHRSMGGVPPELDRTASQGGGMRRAPHLKGWRARTRRQRGDYVEPAGLTTGGHVSDLTARR